MVQSIANFMKMAYVQWNKDSVADEIILNDLRSMSGGELKLEDNVNLAKVEFRSSNPNQNASRGKNQNQNNRGRSNNNNPRNNNNQNNRNRNQGGGGTRKY